MENMITYLFLVFVIIIFQIENDNRIKLKDKMFIIPLIVLFVFAALRGNGAGDYFTYIEYSTYITSISDVLNFNFPMEIGFRVISYFINLIGFHQQFVIIFMNAISIACIGILINKYSSDKMLSVFLFLPFFFQYDMQGSRTATAIGISALGITYILEKKFIKYLLILLIASMFHQTCLILIPFYFFRTIKVSIKFGLITFVISVIMAKIIGINSFIIYLLSLIGLDRIALRYEIYIADTLYGYPFSLLDPRIIISISIFILAKIRLSNPSKTENLLINSAWVASALMILFSENTFFVTRFTPYYTIFTIILIPIIMKRIKTINLGLMELSNYTILYNYYPVKVFIILFFTAYLSVLLYGYVEYKLFF